MRSGTASTERGNTYEQLVRTWRLSEFIVNTLTESNPARWIRFQHQALLPWDDIVESTEPGFVAWQVKSLETPLPSAKLGELLRALRGEKGIHRGVLAVSHALPRPSGPDLMVVNGLAEASRIANGKLPRFDRDKKEHECLAQVASLLGNEDLEEAFQVLGRFEVRVLHGKADVRAMALRALHPLFERPHDLVRALLEFVVDTAASGVQIHFDTLQGQTLDDFDRRRAPWVPVPAGPPDEEILLWHRDSRGKSRTLWLSTKAPGLVVADIPGMYLGSERYLWRWDPCSVYVAFGDDEGYMFEGDEPFDESTIELLPVESARLINVENGIVIPLGVVEDQQLGEWVLSLEHTVEPLGTFGGVFLAWAHAAGYSGGAHGWHSADFVSFDLESGQRFEILTASESSAYIGSHGDSAKRKLREEQDPAADIEDEVPTITICAPYYDDSYTLRTRMQFTFETCYADTDESWDDYHTSTKVDVEKLPQSLAPLATAPAVLRAYWDEHPMDERYGWTRVPTSGPARELLEQLVREHQADRR